jgi:hypothetical protein
VNFKKQVFKKFFLVTIDDIPVILMLFDSEKVCERNTFLMFICQYTLCVTLQWEVVCFYRLYKFQIFKNGWISVSRS